MASGLEPGNVTILIVEDEGAIRTLSETILRREGYIVWSVTSGMEAVRRLEARADSIDLLLTDLSLPEMSGDDVAVRARELKPTLKVIFASGSIGQFPAESLDRVSGAIFLDKPFTREGLLSAVREALNKSE